MNTTNPSPSPETREREAYWPFESIFEVRKCLSKLYDTLGGAEANAVKIAWTALGPQGVDAPLPARTLLFGGDERRHVICLCPDCTKPRAALSAPSAVEALRELVAKLDLMLPFIDAMCADVQNHGRPYRGPTWEPEMANARAVVEGLGKL